MANLHLVTGYAGEGHITAADHGSLYASIFGTGEYVLNRGNMFSASTITNNQIRIADGDIIFQGRHVRLNEGGYVDLSIENGTADTKRNDLIVVRYTMDSETGVEECNLVVIKGTPAASNPSDPPYTVGNIITDHALIADMPLYRVPLQGLNVQTLVPLFTEASISIANGAVTSAKLASSAVTAAKIANGAVTNDKLATGLKKLFATALPNGAVVNNTEYRLSGSIGAYTFSYPSGNFECWIRFTASASDVITWGSGTQFFGDTAPTFESGKTYEVSIKDKVVAYAEVGAGS